MPGKTSFGILLTTLVLSLGGAARAEYVVDVTEVGGDVVAAGSGTIKTTDLTFLYVGGAFVGDLSAASSTVVVGPGLGSGADVDVYNGFVGPTSFGPGVGDSVATGGLGDLVGILNGNGIVVPKDYASGASLTSASTWGGQTFGSLGLTPGTYVWTWGAGADADSFTMNIGGAAVPEPASLALLGLGCIGLAGLARRGRVRG